MVLSYFCAVILKKRGFDEESCPCLQKLLQTRNVVKQGFAVDTHWFELKPKHIKHLKKHGGYVILAASDEPTDFYVVPFSVFMPLLTRANQIKTGALRWNFQIVEHELHIRKHKVDVSTYHGSKVDLAAAMLDPAKVVRKVAQLFAPTLAP